MAEQDQLAIVRQGVTAWNLWRQEDPGRPVDLSGADLSGMDLGGADLSRANLRGVDLHEADLSWADLHQADLSQANLIEADLHRANLREANLNRADLVWANLTSANLRAADLSGANLTEASLESASLGDASLIGANVSAADLTHADLARANLSRSDLSRLRLDETNLERARIGWAVLGDIDLTRVRGLETVELVGPLTIGIDTIYRSRGRVPAEFLRAAGVPDSFATVARSLADGPVPFLTHFIAASRADEEFVDRLCVDLRARGVRAWMYPEGANLGRSIWDEADRSVRIYDRLILVCSERSLGSESVLMEVERLLRRETRDEEWELLPIVLDDHLSTGWQHELRAELEGRVVADFRGWDRDPTRYWAALDDLITALTSTA